MREEKLSLSDVMACYPPEYPSILLKNKMRTRLTPGWLDILCEICHVRFRTIPEAMKHVNDPSHNSAIMVFDLHNLVKYLPPITEAHRTALNHSLANVTLNFISEEELERRREFAQLLCVILESRIKGLKMRLTGSILMDFSLEQSDVNLDACLDPVEVSELFNSEETNVLSLTDTYYQYISSALPEIFEVLCPTNSNVIATDTHSLPVLPKLNRVSKVYQTDNYSVIVEDCEQVKYHITAGNPHGGDFANLVRTYLSIDYRAKHLMILLIKFSELAHLNMISKPVLYAMGIFFLQNITPPVLPNLHELARRHHNEIPLHSVEVVKIGKDDFSYLKDLSLIPQFLPAKNSMTMADIWLKFLRFYVLEFQFRSCIISITHSEPVSKSSRNNHSCGLWVENPFSPDTPLTTNLVPSAEKFIQDQFIAAYGYFGVPRLSKTGYPLFHKVSIDLTPSASMEVPLKFIPIDDLNHRLDKVVSSFTAYIDDKAVPNADLKTNVSATNIEAHEKRFALKSILPQILQLAYGEICPAHCVKGIQQCCSKRALRYLNRIHWNTHLSSLLATKFFRAYCRDLWLAVQERYQCSVTCSTETQLARFGMQIFRKTTQAVAYMMQENSSPLAAAAATNHTNREEEYTGPITLCASSCLSPVVEPHCLGDMEAKISASPYEESIEKEPYLSYVSDQGGRVIDPISRDADAVSELDETEKKRSEKVPCDECDENDVPDVANPCPSDMSHSADAWSKYIKINDNYFVIRDSDKLGFYSSSKVSLMKPEDLSFAFDVRPCNESNFLSNLDSDSSIMPSSMIAHTSSHPSACTLCGALGHGSTSCVADPSVSVGLAAWKKLEATVPKVTNPTHIEELSTCLIQLSQFHFSREVNFFRQEVVQGLTLLFQPAYPNIELKLFGSCVNGFETATSDMDICVMFPLDSPQAASLANRTERLTLLKNFRRLLGKGSRKFRISNVRPVYFAKVPIIKFTVNNQFEVDLSFSNILAVHNTEMLRFYNSIDPRLRVLTIALKIILKASDVPKSDAGGLSSYAYAIMLIHYLQQKGFLPVLQELHEECEKPVIRVGRWNVWYQSDVQVIRKYWKPPDNDSTAAELWLGFLRYYLFEFDREHYVVTIKQLGLLDRLKQLWNTLLAVQDPFNLSHNLTHSVERKVFNQVLNSLYNVLMRHTTLIRRQMTLNHWKYCLFAPQKPKESTEFKAIKNTKCPSKAFKGASRPQTSFCRPKDATTISIPAEEAAGYRSLSGIAASFGDVPSNQSIAPHQQHQLQRKHRRGLPKMIPAQSFRESGAGTGTPSTRGTGIRGGRGKHRNR